MTHASFGERALATLIDMLWMIPMALLLHYLLYGADAFSEALEPRPGAEIVSWIVPAVVIINFWLTSQATPGKMVMGLRIVDAETGGMPGVGQYTLRYFGYLVSGIPFALGYLWMLFDSRRQTWHDKIGRTVVIRGKR
ncbi:MAG: RDD family protein [Geminicoccaceae bacterium]|nr:RDD family protein [Geminicoccaceae bacterium]